MANPTPASTALTQAEDVYMPRESIISKYQEASALSQGILGSLAQVKCWENKKIGRKRTTDNEQRLLLLV